MASLKDIKNRMLSVNGTLKITSAMKMIASSKLHKAQIDSAGIFRYEESLQNILINLLGQKEEELSSPFTEKREVKKIALVILSSNSGLCGSFNSNVIRKTIQVLTRHKDKDIIIYPIGQKAAKTVQKLGYHTIDDYLKIADKISYTQVLEFGKKLIAMFLNKEVDQIELIYTHSLSLGSQEVRDEVFLPFSLPTSPKEDYDYILEPSAERVLAKLFPQLLLTRIYSVVQDSSLSEHSARTIAMQIATDNADNLQQELSVLYNKSRQQAITNELLDMENGMSD